jgi:hypothetical protein
VNGERARQGLRVEIGELVIEGFGNDRPAVVRALAAELTAAFAREGVAAAPAVAVQVATAIGGAGTIAPPGAAARAGEGR